MTFSLYIACLIAAIAATIAVNLILSGTIVWSGVIGVFIGLTALYLLTRQRSGNQPPTTEQ